MDLRNQVHLPLLAAELPSGWSVSEAATVVAPSGLAIRASLDRAAEGIDATVLIDRHLGDLTDEYGEPANVSTSTSRWRGSAVAHYLTVRFDEPPHTRVIATVVDSGLALTVTGAWSTPGDDGTRDVEAAVAGIRLLSRPLFEPDLDAEQSDLTVPVVRGAVPSEVWEQLHGDWSSRRGMVSEPDAHAIWSTDELATVATMLGAPSFPSVGPELFATLTDAQMRAVLGATIRSLAARGLVHIRSDGSAVLDDSARSAMETALFPDLAISVESGGGSTSVATYFGVRPDSAVRIDVTPSGGRSCGAVDPVDVVDALVELLGVRDGGVHGQRVTLHVQSDDMLERWGAMDAGWQVSATWRDRDVIAGSVLYAARDVDGQFWIAESDDDQTWTIRPLGVEDVRGEILGRLPGSA